MIRARKVLKKRYGRIYIRFHEPLSLNDLLSPNGDGKSLFRAMMSKEQNRVCRDLGHRLMNAIDRMTVVTPHAIVAGAALNCSRQRFSLNDLMGDVETYMSHLFSEEVPLADTLLVDYLHAVEYVFDLYVQRRFIERISKERESGASGECFRVNPAKRPILEYYKNNGISFFVPAAFTALSILEKDAFQFSISDLRAGHSFLLEFFSNEFAHDVEESPERSLRGNIRTFVHEAILMPHPTLPDAYNLTSAGFRKLKLLSSFLKTYFESYRIVLNFFMRYPRNFIDAKDRLNKIQSMGHRMFKRNEIERPEALFKVNYTNAMDFFTSHGVRGSENTEKIEFYADAIRRYLEHLA